MAEVTHLAVEDPDRVESAIPSVAGDVLTSLIHSAELSKVNRASQAPILPNGRTMQASVIPG
jgi:hypothetical protein